MYQIEEKRLFIDGEGEKETANGLYPLVMILYFSIQFLIVHI